MIPRRDVTGLVLAGGQGRRMGGVDKGLVDFDGQPLARLALDRLSPQTGACMISANRHLDRYGRFGVPVVTDAAPGHPGPLAGLLAGLQACATPWLATVPCDSPRFPADLVARLAQAAEAAQAEVAMAITVRADGAIQPQPVFCLVSTALAADLADFVAQGGASPRAWAARCNRVDVPFDDADAFENVNTPDDLRRLGG